MTRCKETFVFSLAAAELPYQQRVNVILIETRIQTAICENLIFEAPSRDSTDSLQGDVYIPVRGRRITATAIIICHLIETRIPTTTSENPTFKAPSQESTNSVQADVYIPVRGRPTTPPISICRLIGILIQATTSQNLTSDPRPENLLTRCKETSTFSLAAPEILHQPQYAV